MTIWALAKNYLEISRGNVCRYIQDYEMPYPTSKIWSNLSVFLRYQEIHFDPKFYQLVTCPQIGRKQSQGQGYEFKGSALLEMMLQKDELHIILKFRNVKSASIRFSSIIDQKYV